jgi:hypothetical protein
MLAIHIIEDANNNLGVSIETAKGAPQPDPQVVIGLLFQAAGMIITGEARKQRKTPSSILPADASILPQIDKLAKR